MYNMEFDRPPSKPVIPSHASASAEFSTWVRQNRYDTLVDGAGLAWDVDVELKQLPDPSDLKASIWSIEITVSALPSAEDFFKTGTLSPTLESDQRLGDLLEETRVPLRIRTIKHEASTLEDLRAFASEVLPKIREHLAGQSFHDLKRQRAAALVKESRVFGGSDSISEEPA